MTKASVRLGDTLAASTPHRGGFHFNKTQELLCRNLTAFYLVENLTRREEAESRSGAQTRVLLLVPRMKMQRHSGGRVSGIRSASCAQFRDRPS